MPVQTLFTAGSHRRRGKPGPAGSSALALGSSVDFEDPDQRLALQLACRARLLG
jgi:hypothetical protein